MRRRNVTPEMRFWAKVEKRGEDDCWLWKGARCGTNRMYGQGSINKKKILAHRLSFLFANGNLPDDLEVCHICDNGLCVNPKHLWLGTHLENMMDRGRKGKVSKLTEYDVLKVRDMITEGLTDKQIAPHFGVLPAAIWNIRNGRNWLHIMNESDIVPIGKG